MRDGECSDKEAERLEGDQGGRDSEADREGCGEEDEEEEKWAASDEVSERG